jgi:thiol oxidase
MPSQSSPSSNEDQNSNVTTEMLLERHFYDTARKLNPMPLFRADLEQAIRNTLSHEIPQHETITGESLNALRNFVSVLYRYYEFGNQISFRKLVDYVTQPSKTEIKGEEFKIFIDKLIPPIIRKSRYVGCYSTSKGLRRFPCSLWTLFHHLTIQHLESEHNDDPMEVLHAIHGYVKYFFGCSDCSRHFQEMSKRNHIWNVTSKDQAVLWLWNAHNEVNQRLHGDITEDSNHPKLQFPAEEHCHVCRKKNGEWDKTEVLEFLRRHYINERVSNLGLDEDQMPRALMLNARARQMFAGGLGESHLHIGILAYVAIIVCMMILAVKFYFRRGYRKKLYAHDILGKV